MGIFARRPAPIQVNYLGFPATLGAPYIDYIIADKVVIPPAEQISMTNRWCICRTAIRPMMTGPSVAATPTRAEVGLPDKALVFCNFNTAYKLTPETFDSWMRILKQT